MIRRLLKKGRWEAKWRQEQKSFRTKSVITESPSPGRRQGVQHSKSVSPPFCSSEFKTSSSLLGVPKHSGQIRSLLLFHPPFWLTSNFCCCGKLISSLSPLLFLPTLHLFCYCIITIINGWEEDTPATHPNYGSVIDQVRKIYEAVVSSMFLQSMVHDVCRSLSEVHGYHSDLPRQSAPSTCVHMQHPRSTREWTLTFPPQELWINNFSELTLKCSGLSALQRDDSEGCVLYRVKL